MGCAVKKPRQRGACDNPVDMIYSANGFKEVELCFEHWAEACEDIGIDTPAWLEKNTKAKRSKA